MQQPKNIILFCLIFAILNPVIPVSAREQSVAPLLDLQQCIEKAVENNPRVLGSMEQRRQAVHEKKRAASDFYPELNIDYSYTYLDEVAGFDGITVGQRNSWAMQIHLDQPLFTGFKILNNYELAKIGLNSAAAETELTRLDIIFQTTQAYFELLKAEKYREVVDDAVVHLKSHLANSQKFYDHGVIPLNDLLEAKVNLANARQDARTAQSRVRLARYRLANLMDKPTEFKFNIEDRARETGIETDLSDLLRKAYEKRPLLKRANYNLKSARQRVDLARSDYLPTVSLRASHNRYGTDPLVNGQGLSDFSEPEENTISVTAVWNLWAGGGTREEVNRARAGVREAGHILSEVKNEINLDVENNFEQAYTAYANIKPARLAVSQAEEHLRMTRERYQEQLSTNTDVLDARRLLTETKFKYYQALYDYNILLASLARSTGGSINDYGLGTDDRH